VDRLRDKVALISGGGGSIGAATAGIFGVPGTIADYPEDVFDRVMAVNVRGCSSSPSTRWRPCVTVAA
jgi:NAD(P)-dependent dehydrogenase (short-subunit alcohol dehydrogenase family)